MIRLLRRVLRLGLLGGVGYGLVRTLRGRTAGTRPWASDPWISTGPAGQTVPSPSPAATAAPSVAPAPPAGSEPPASSRPAPSRPPKAPGRTGPARKPPTGKAAPPERLWVQANDGVCPQSHPVKAKLSSKIFHTPGGRNYSRTKADRCYPDEQSAAADGLRPAQH